MKGFSRCVRGPDGGAYHHPSFLRGNAALALNIIRTKIKGNGHKTMTPLSQQPDFRKMAPLCNNPPPKPLKTVPKTLIYPKTYPELVSTPVSPTSTISSSMLASIEGSLQQKSDSTNLENLDEINKSIFMHELAVGCTILCKLRQDASTL